MSYPLALIKGGAEATPSKINASVPILLKVYIDIPSI